MSTLTQADFATQAGHWYARDGSPAYTVTGKNGKVRAATLRDARELDLVPSVTAILKLEAAPALENWRVMQALLSAMTLPRIEGESEDSFMRRALDDSRQQAIKAAERGTYLHGLLEKVMVTRATMMSSEDAAIIMPVVNWLDVNFSGYSWSPERSFACEHGFGGKLDLHGTSGETTVILDYKFKADIIPGKTLAYDNHSTQLAAYANGLNCPRARCVNLFISSTEPGVIVPVEWESADIEQGWKAFECLLALWKCRRKL